MSYQNLKIAFITGVSLTAFAANSVLCRLALEPTARAELAKPQAEVDPMVFTLLRLLSGALFLALLVWLKNRSSTQPAQMVIKPVSKRHSWIAASMLFIYAVGFSWAYISMQTGTGALILFSAVQFTIMGFQLSQGLRYTLKEWIGIALAFAGFVYLFLPQLASPAWLSAMYMSAAGVAWGVYTIMGKHSQDALKDTMINFALTLPMMAALVIVLIASQLYDVPRPSARGVLLALASGALASGLGYALWYSVIKQLPGPSSALLQLAVPLLASAGGLVFSNEALTVRFAISAALCLSGIAIVVLASAKKRSLEPKVNPST